MTPIMPARSKRELPLATRQPQTGVAPFSQTAEYALRALSCLADSPEPLRAVDLAQRTQVPVHYLSKVLRRLVSAGLLVSQKGHRGGFVLSRQPKQIRFLDVLEAVGEAPVAGRCAFGWDRCDSKNPCPLHPAWAALSESLAEWARDTTLADVQDPVRTRRR